MFVLESVICGGEATEKKFDTDAAAFVAMKESWNCQEKCSLKTHKF